MDTTTTPSTLPDKAELNHREQKFELSRVPRPNWRRRLKRVLLLCFLSSALSCASKAQLWPSSGTYRGIYVLGFERNDFIPENSKERWWLWGEIGELRRRMTGPARFNEVALASPVSLVVEGELSARGRYGRPGLYRRALQVTRVVEVHQASRLHQ